MAERQRGGYRTLRQPGPCLALIAEPGGCERLWSRLRHARRAFACANCGRPASPGYRPSILRPEDAGLRLCVVCAVGEDR